MKTIKTIKTVLLIDDDADEHVWFREALEIYDNTIVCLTAYNSQQGLNLIKQDSPDLIFLDFNMPAINGLKCLKIIKEMSAFKEIPVYMYSISKVSNKEKSVALELGAVEWFTKPFKIEDYKKIFTEAFNKLLSPS